jgi:hypothetical protein
VNLNGILERKFLPKNADTVPRHGELHRVGGGAFSVWTEFMVRVRVRVRVAVRVVGAFSVATEFTVPTGKRQWAPERNAIGHTQGSASSGGVKA